MIEQLEQALGLTRDMLEAIKAASWDQAALLQQQRELIILDTAKKEPPKNRQESIKIQQVIESIQALEKEIEPLLKGEQSSVFKQHQNQQKRKKMVQAYKDIGG